MSKVHDIRHYKPTSGDLFFFDNNVWMFLYCPLVNAKKQQQDYYSSFFKSVRSTHACIWINSLVLSEFCNAWLRIAFNNWKKRPANIGKEYKSDFVLSETYQKEIEHIKQILPQMLKITERCSDNFNSIDMNAVYAELNNCDFNDSYYLELARKNKWKIVTDDADLFKNNQLNVEIITANIK